MWQPIRRIRVPRVGPKESAQKTALALTRLIQGPVEATQLASGNNDVRFRRRSVIHDGAFHPRRLRGGKLSSKLSKLNGPLPDVLSATGAGLDRPKEVFFLIFSMRNEAPSARPRLAVSMMRTMASSRLALKLFTRMSPRL